MNKDETRRDEVNPPACYFCGEPEEVELFEIWDGRDFQISTCCEGLHEELTREIADDPAFARELLRELGAEDVTGRELRSIADDDYHLVLDWRLEVRPIALADARAFVLEHHAHSAPPVGWRFGAGIWNGEDLVGVVTVGRPVSRHIDQERVVEVTRLCVRRDLAPALVRNACSQLYAWSAREAARRGFDVIMTYTLESEPGVTLKAAGWRRDILSRGGSWNRPGRAREDAGPTEPKRRWIRILNERPFELAA